MYEIWALLQNSKHLRWDSPFAPLGTCPWLQTMSLSASGTSRTIGSAEPCGLSAERFQPTGVHVAVVFPPGPPAYGLQAPTWRRLFLCCQ